MMRPSIMYCPITSSRCMISRGVKPALGGKRLLVGTRVAHDLSREPHHEPSVVAEDVGVDVVARDGIELLLRPADSERDRGVLDPLIVRARRHRGDTGDRELAQKRIQLVAVEQSPAEAHPSRERPLGVGDHPEDAEIGRPGQHLGYASFRLVGVEVWKPCHRVPADVIPQLSRSSTWRRS